MRNRLISSLAGAAFSFAGSGLALAADMAVKAPPPAPAPPPISWTGWYGGINVGGTWSDDSSNVNTANEQCFGGAGGLICGLGTVAAQAATGGFSSRGAGFIGGGQFGYNWQFNSWVAGFEADFQGTRVKATGESISNINLGSIGADPSFSLRTDLSVTKEIDYVGTVRGRLGWLAAPSLLVYGTGGLAYGGVKASTSISQVQLPNSAVGGVPNNFGNNSGISQTRTGWTAGGGFEWMFVPQWSVKVEYLYYDLGSVTYNGQEAVLALPGSGISGPIFSNNVQTTTRFTGNIVRAGVNWHFW